METKLLKLILIIFIGCKYPGKVFCDSKDFMKIIFNERRLKSITEETNSLYISLNNEAGNDIVATILKANEIYKYGHTEL